jgi:NAD(P)-dependent dehydrogenase (short-subunit alcohol dehydrogenase family)
MACILVTGSTEGLGRTAAEALISDGHRVVLHARSKYPERALRDISEVAAGVVSLAAVARQRLAAGQGVLDLGPGFGRGPLPITSSRMGHCWMP